MSLELPSRCSECGGGLPAGVPVGLCPRCALQAAANLTEPADLGVPTAQAGDHIGRYKLLQQIGEGGCGVVFMAEQSEPIRRKVALKVIKLGMDTRSVIARFEAERQALALMDHPNIAKVLDAGATDTGRPYFVMELVRGAKITDFCDQHKLTTRARLDLFMQVCHAIQHAHQKGIIHRDIKPSNILVTLHDGPAAAGSPKVIDFGIAKATSDQRLTDKTLFTAFEQFMGTPAYMSPEQAEMSGLDIDTRSDIYSLGVLLYELLTGKTPFDAKELWASGLDAMRRTIREKEPVKPSTRLNTLAESDRTEIAKHRQTEPNKLSTLVRGDLDWIAMKCLEKDRTRRYETANGLAADLKRHLENEPVSASPPSVLYRFQKTVRRNKLAFAAAGAVLVSLVIGLGTTTVMFSKEQAARGAEAKQRQEVEKMAVAESKAKDLANLQRGRAEELLGRLMQQKAEDLFTAGDSAAALAWLAKLVRDQPSNSVAAQRLLSALTWRSFPICTMSLTDRDSFLPGCFSEDGRKLVVLKQFSPRIWDVASGQPLTPPFLHITNVVLVALNSNGAMLATYAGGDSVQLWEVATGRFITELRPYANNVENKGHWSVNSLEFSPDGHRLLTHSGRAVDCWELSTGQKLASIGLVLFQSARWSPDGEGVITVMAGKEARIWNARTGQPVGTTFQHFGPMVFSPDGHLFLAAGTNYFQCHDVRTGQPVGVRWPRTGLVGPGSGRRVPFPQFAHDGRWVLTEIAKDSWALLDFQSGEVQGNRFMTRAVDSVALNPDESRFATLAADGIRLYETRTGQELRSALAAQRGIKSFSFSPDGLSLATVDDSHTVRVLEITTGLPVCEPIASDEWVEIQWGADSRHLIRFSPLVPSSGGTYGLRSVAIFDIRPGHALPEYLSSKAFSQMLCLSSDGKRVVTCNESNAQVWDTRTLQPATSPLTHSSRVRSARFTADDRTILTATDDALRAWDMEANGQPRHPPILQPHGYATAVGRLPPFDAFGAWQGIDGTSAFSPDGTRVLVFESKNPRDSWSSEFTRIALKTVPDGKVLVEIDLPGKNLNLVQFSPDSRWLGLLTNDQSLVIWDARLGKRMSGPAQRSGVHQAVVFQFSPDGKRLVLAGWVGGSRIGAWIYDWERAAVAVHLEEDGIPFPLGNAPFARFSPDGEFVTVVSGGIGRIWSAQTGKLMPGVIKQEGSIHAARFTADGKRLLTESVRGLDLGLVALWDASTGDLVGERYEHRGVRSEVRPDVSFDGAWIATRQASNTVRIWDSSSHQPVSEPLRVKGRISGLYFADGDQRLLVSSTEGVQSWDVRLAGNMDSIDAILLAEIAEAVAGKRLTQQRSYNSDSLDRLRELRAQIYESQTRDGFNSWAKWFLADRSQRTISPFSTMTVPEYVQRRIDENTRESLLQAVQFNPTNALAFARLAVKILAETNNENSRRVGEADFFSRRAIELSPNDSEVQRIRAETVEQIKLSSKP